MQEYIGNIISGAFQNTRTTKYSSVVSSWSIETGHKYQYQQQVLYIICSISDQVSDLRRRLETEGHDNKEQRVKDVARAKARSRLHPHSVLGNVFRMPILFEAHYIEDVLLTQPVRHPTSLSFVTVHTAVKTRNKTRANHCSAYFNSSGYLYMVKY